MANKSKSNVASVQQPTFKLTELAYSLRIITNDYEFWCNKQIPSDDSE